MRIANFASGGYAAATRRAERKRSTSSEADQSGTYRATLVQPVLESSSDEEAPEEARQDKERRPLMSNGATEQTAASKREDSSNLESKAIAVKPLQTRPEPEHDNRIESENDLAVTRANNKPAKACKRVVLYDDTTEDRGQLQQPIVSLTEVYNIVSEFGEARAKLRRVSLVSAQPEDNVSNHSEDNERPENEDKRARDSEAASASLPPTRATCELSRDKRSVFVQSLVQSIEMNGNFQGVAAINEGGEHRRLSGPTSLLNNIENNLDSRNRQKPILLVKSLPPKTPPKTNKAKCLNIQLSLNKPLNIHQLFQDERFLRKFFINLEPLDRCKAAQVCRLWRNLLYANRDYWKGR